MGAGVVRVLGRLEIWHDGGQLRLPATRPVALFSLLTVSPGRWRDTEELIDILWHGRPTRSALSNLRTHVYEWRRLLAPLSDQVAIDGIRGAYRVRLAPGILDAENFESHVLDGSEALDDGDPRRAARAFESALRLWRGEPFLSISATAFAERARLGALHERAQSGLAVAYLELQRTTEALALLRQAVASRPFDEAAWATLMNALADTGRRADALAAYQEVHHLLRAELGLAPGQELRQVLAKVTA